MLPHINHLPNRAFPSLSPSYDLAAGLEEETGEYRIPHPDGENAETSKEESAEDASDHNVFSEVSEVRFPSEVGPLGDRRLCKIVCSAGRWVGPLCASLDDGELNSVNALINFAFDIIF